MTWLAAFVAQILMKLLPWAFTKLMEYKHGNDSINAADESVDARLARLKAAYQNQFDGKPVTPEQREEMRNALSDFIRGGTTGGL